MGRNQFFTTRDYGDSPLAQVEERQQEGTAKEIRHELRVDYEFNISDFNVQGKAFGPDELQEAIRRGVIVILDETTIAQMKAKRARDRARDEAARQAEAVASGEVTDWQQAQAEWEAWEKTQAEGSKKKANLLAIPNKIPIFAL